MPTCRLYTSVYACTCRVSCTRVCTHGPAVDVVPADDDGNIRDCTEWEFGCCSDGVTMAPGPNQAGCPGSSVLENTQLWTFLLVGVHTFENYMLNGNNKICDLFISINIVLYICTLLQFNVNYLSVISPVLPSFFNWICTRISSM